MPTSERNRALNGPASAFDLTIHHVTLICQTAAYVYAKFALKFGNMYRKGSENSTLALAGKSVI